MKLTRIVKRYQERAVKARGIREQEAARAWYQRGFVDGAEYYKNKILNATKDLEYPS